MIEFYANRCAPCRVYGPIFERVARRYEGRVDFYRVNIDADGAEYFPGWWEFNSVPTTAFAWDPDGDCTIKDKIDSAARVSGNSWNKNNAAGDYGKVDYFEWDWAN